MGQFASESLASATKMCYCYPTSFTYPLFGTNFREFFSLDFSVRRCLFSVADNAYVEFLECYLDKIVCND